MAEKKYPFIEVRDGTLFIGPLAFTPGVTWIVIGILSVLYFLVCLIVGTTLNLSPAILFPLLIVLAFAVVYWTVVGVVWGLRQWIEQSSYRREGY